MTVNPLSLVGIVPAPAPGADGQISRIVELCVSRIAPRQGTVADYLPEPGTTGGRSFDLAELVAWAALTAGVRPKLPDTTEQLIMACRTTRNMYEFVSEALSVKGALLYGAAGQLGLAIGWGRRVIVYSAVHGLVPVTAETTHWVEAARIPGARGYQP